MLFNFTMLALPYFDKILIDSITKNSEFNYSNSLHLLSYGFILFLSIWFVSLFKDYFFQKQYVRMLCEQKKDILKQIVNSKLEQYDKHEIGHYLNLLDTDSEFVGDYLGILTKYFQEVVLIVIASIILFFLNWQLTLISLLTLPVAIFIILKFKDRIHKYNKNFMTTLSSLKDFEQNIISGKRIVYRFDKNNYLLETIYNNKIQCYINDNLKLNKSIIYVYNSLDVIPQLIHILLIVIGGYFIQRDSGFTMGSLIAFIGYVSYLIKPIISLSDIKIQKKMIDVNLERIVELFDEYKEVSMEMKEINLNSNIQICNLSFNFGNHDIFQNLNMKFLKNNLNIIYGKSGTGKSTLGQIINGDRTGYKGSIKIGKYELNQINREIIKKKIIYCEATPFLFNFSVYENIIFSEKIYSQNENIVKEISSKLKIEDLLDKIIDKNINLSDGQKKRIEIARALIQTDAEIYIFDEPTANLDTNNAINITNFLNDLSKTKTVIILCHDKIFEKFNPNIYYMRENE